MTRPAPMVPASSILADVVRGLAGRDSSFAGGTMISVMAGAAQTFSRRDLSAGSVVAVLAAISVMAVALVFLLSYAMYVRNRR